MDIQNLKACISHDEAMIRSFVRDPDYADYYLKTVIADGDNDEICDVQAWYDAAKLRSQTTTYWDDILSHAQETARNGYNLNNVIASVSQALDILKAALPAHA